MLGMCKTKHSSKDCDRCLLIVSKIDILWSSWRRREFINHNFKQVIEPSLVLNIISLFWLLVDWLHFLQEYFKSNCILLLCHVPVRSSCQELFCRKGVLRNFAKFAGKCLCYSLFFKKETLAEVFSCEFREIFKNFLSYRKPLVAVSGVSEWIYTL